jgi:hypothetical protein
VAASRESGRAVGADLVAAFRAGQRPFGGVPGSRSSGKSGVQDTQPVVPFRGQVARQLVGSHLNMARLDVQDNAASG